MLKPNHDPAACSRPCTFQTIRTIGVAAEGAQARAASEQDARTTTPPRSAVVVGRDGGYVRSRHRQEERHFEVVAGKVINATGTQRFAFAPTARRPPRTRSLRRLARRSRDARRHAGAVQGSCRILAAKARGAAGSHGRADHRRQRPLNLTEPMKHSTEVGRPQSASSNLSLSSAGKGISSW